MSDHLRIWLIVPKGQAKSTKIALEKQGTLDKTTKIQVWEEGQVPSTGTNDGKETASTHVAIPTTMSPGDTDRFDSDCENMKSRTLRELGLEGQRPEISIMMRTRQTVSSSSSAPPMNPLKASVQKWLQSLPSTLFDQLGLSSDGLYEAFPRTYSLYHPMLLLPSRTFSSQAWSQLLQAVQPAQKQQMYECLTTALGCSHLAINAPIPSSINDRGCDDELATDKESINTLRAPTDLQPLYGNFGSLNLVDPSPGDFEHAFWVSTRQNGIYQTWAPLYTMFSRGNITEKARILKLPSLVKGADNISAVDLYSGIGYFTFSYAAAGVGRVFCWELNPWSLEGLRRGARVNGWDVTIVQQSCSDEAQDIGDEKILAFQEDNINAPKRIKAWRAQIPPIRHVNCGLLPTSRGSWETAVNVLDEAEGGWIHVHENIAEKDVQKMRDEIVSKFIALVNECNRVGEKSLSMPSARMLRQVECQHVEAVKSFSPGTMHYVLDIWVSPPGG